MFVDGLMSDGCEWLSGERSRWTAPKRCDRRQFLELRRWGDGEWKAARDAIQALNARDKARRG